MGRPKSASVQLSSIDEANRALRQMLLAEVELEKHTGWLDLDRAAATAKHEKAIDRQKAAIADLTLQLQTFYMTNHKELEKDGSKSVRLAFGVIGRRLGRPALKPLNRSWTWSSIGIKLRSIYNARFFHAPKEPEVDREKARQDLTAEQLHECGLKVEQEDTFFAETDRTKIGEAGGALRSFFTFMLLWILLLAAAAIFGAVLPIVLEQLL